MNADHRSKHQCRVLRSVECSWQTSLLLLGTQASLAGRRLLKVMVGLAFGGNKFKVLMITWLVSSAVLVFNKAVKEKCVFRSQS